MTTIEQEQQRVCSDCGATETYSNWRLDGKGGWLCKKCYMKHYFRKPKIVDKHRARMREYMRTNPDKKLAWIQANFEKWRQYHIEYGREYRRKKKEEEGSQ